MNITIYTFTYNEELLIQFMIDHYRFRFPNCHIVIYDNSSTDNTVNIALSNNCEIRHYNSGGYLNDQIHLDIKNNCWKDANTDWVLVQDLDELLNINEEQLKIEESLGNTKIMSECWNMVNMEDNLDIKNICYGYRGDLSVNGTHVSSKIIYDKDLLFNKKYIQEINYTPGAHYNNPIGIIKNSITKYKMFHYRYINPDLYVKKYMLNTLRISELNKKNGWGNHSFSGEDFFRKEFEIVRKSAIKIL